MVNSLIVLADRGLLSHEELVLGTGSGVEAGCLNIKLRLRVDCLFFHNHLFLNDRLFLRFAEAQVLLFCLHIFSGLSLADIYFD